MKEAYNLYEREPKINSTVMRISVLEDRMKSLEKMLRLYEERINIKEEEKINEIKSLESNNAIISKLTKKVKNLEKKVEDMTIQKLKAEAENSKIIEDLNKKIKNLEEIIKMNNNQNEEINNINNEDINKNINRNLINEEENANIILNDFNEIMEEKIYNASMDNENKINELLNLIHDLNKILEENEDKIDVLTNNFNKFQSDNVNIIQMMSIQEEKINNIDFLYEEIHKLKNEIHNLASNLDDKNEEEKFTKQFLNSTRLNNV